MSAAPPQEDNEKRRLVLELVTRLRCVRCGRRYDPEDFALIHRWQDMWVLSTRCRHCNELCQVVVFMHLQARPEPVVDLTPEEIRAAAQQPPITADDVLDVHLKLCEFEGDFEALFSA